MRRVRGRILWASALGALAAVVSADPTGAPVPDPSASVSVSASASASNYIPATSISASASEQAPIASVSVSVSASASAMAFLPTESISASASGFIPEPSATVSPSFSGVDVSTTTSISASALGPDMSFTVSASASAEMSAMFSTSASANAPEGSFTVSPSGSFSSMPMPSYDSSLSPSASASAVPIPSFDASLSPSASGMASALPSGGASGSVSASASVSASGGVWSSMSVSVTASASPSGSGSASASVSSSVHPGLASITTSVTASASMSSELTASVTPSGSGSASVSSTPTPIPSSAVPSPSSSALPSAMPSVGPAPILWLHPGSIPRNAPARGIVSGASPTGADLEFWANHGAGGASLDATVDAGTDCGGTCFLGFPQVLPGALNGHDVVRFPNGPNFIVGLNAANSASTILVVARIYDATNPQRVVTGKSNPWVLGYDAGKEDTAVLGGQVLANKNAPVLRSWRLYELVVDNSGAAAFFRDGRQLGFSRVAAGSRGPNILRLGGDIRATALLTSFADIAEVVVFDRPLREQERINAEEYLASKYGLTLASPAPSASPVAPDSSVALPSDFTTLALWLRPEGLAAGPLTAWPNAVPGTAPLTAAAHVQANALNTWSVVHTSVSGGPFVFANMPTSYTLMILARPRGGQGVLAGNAAESVVIGFADTTEHVFVLGVPLSSQTSPYPAAAPAPWRLFEIVMDGTAKRATAYADGVQLAQVTNVNFVSPSALQIGAGNFEIAEVVVFSEALASTARARVEGYLLQKFGLQSILPPTNPFATMSPAFTMPPTTTAAASLSRTPTATSTTTVTPSVTRTPSSTASPSSSALPAELPPTVTFITFQISITAPVDLNLFTRPDVARDFRASIARFVGLPTRNILILRIFNALGVLIMEFSLSSPLNRVSEARRLAEVDELEIASVKVFSDARMLQSGGISVETKVITSDLGGGAVDPSFTQNILSRVQNAVSNPASMLGDFIDSQGSSLGISRDDVNVKGDSIASGGGATPGGPSTGTPVGAIAGGVAAAVVVLVVVGIAVYYVVFRKRPVPPEDAADADKDVDGVSSAVQPVGPVTQTLYVTPDGAPSNVPVPTAGPIAVTAVNRPAEPAR